MLNSASLFALTKTNDNTLLVTILVSAKYLNKYAAGKKEHSQVTIKWRSSTDNYRAKTNDRGQNHRVRSLKDLNDKKRPFSGIQGVNIAQTEFLWWLLRLPATTTLKFFQFPY